MAEGFKCEDCGIAHKHEEGYDHSLSGAFSLATVVLSLDLDYNPDCHCGWHELNAKIDKGELNVNDVIAEFVEYRCKRLVVPDSVEKEVYESAGT
jgi:hypothetical protein